MGGEEEESIYHQDQPRGPSSAPHTPRQWYQQNYFSTSYSSSSKIIELYFSFAAGEMVFLSHPLLTTRLLSGPVIPRCQDPCLGCRDNLEVHLNFPQKNTESPSRAEPLTLSTKKERERRGELFRRPPRLPPRTCPRPRSENSTLLAANVSGCIITVDLTSH